MPTHALRFALQASLRSIGASAPASAVAGQAGAGEVVVGVRRMRTPCQRLGARSGRERERCVSASTLSFSPELSRSGHSVPRFYLATAVLAAQDLDIGHTGKARIPGVSKCGPPPVASIQRASCFQPVGNFSTPPAASGPGCRSPKAHAYI